MTNGFLQDRATGEQGSTLVEFAMVAGVLFTMVFTGIAFAIIEAGNNAGANAAREGARVATLNYGCADMYTGCTSSSALTAITAAVDQHLSGLSAGTPTVVVACLSGAVTPPTTKRCDPSVIVPGVDLVRVTVTWTHLASSPFSSATTQTNSATMVVAGSGVGTSDPSACIVISGSVSPNQASIGNVASGPITSPSGGVTVTAATNGLCASLYLSFSTGTTQQTPIAMTPSGSSFTYLINSSYTWDPGTYNMTFSDSSGNAYAVSPIPTLTISGATCSVISATLNPSAVVINGSTSPGYLTQNVTLTVTTSSACTALSTTFTPNTTTGPITLALTGTGSPFTLTIGENAYQWDAGSSQFTLSSGGTALNSGSNGTLLLQVNTQCAINVAITPETTFSASSPPTLTVTATPVTHANCTGLTMTYQYAPGTAHIVTSSMSNQGNGTSTATIPSTTSWHQGTWTMTFSSTNATTVSTSPTPIQVVAT